MSNLDRYLFLFEQLQGDLDDDLRIEYEEEIDDLYYALDSDETEYIMEKELEM